MAAAVANMSSFSSWEQRGGNSVGGTIREEAEAEEDKKKKEEKKEKEIEKKEEENLEDFELFLEHLALLHPLFPELLIPGHTTQARVKRE